VDAVFGIALPAVEEVVQDEEAPYGLQVRTFADKWLVGPLRRHDQVEPSEHHIS